MEQLCLGAIPQSMNDRAFAVLVGFETLRGRAAHRPREKIGKENNRARKFKIRYAHARHGLRYQNRQGTSLAPARRSWLPKGKKQRRPCCFFAPFTSVPWY